MQTSAQGLEIKYMDWAYTLNESWMEWSSLDMNGTNAAMTSQPRLWLAILLLFVHIFNSNHAESASQNVQIKGVVYLRSGSAVEKTDSKMGDFVTEWASELK